MTRGLLVLAATCALAVSSVAAATTTPIITQRDSGKTFTTRMGRQLTVRLSERYRWTRPKVTGEAIRLSPVNYIRDPGFQEWNVHPRTRGTARITAVGYVESGTRGCDPGPCAPRLFRVTIVVR
jgi:hypothetical protein